MGVVAGDGAAGRDRPSKVLDFVSAAGAIIAPAPTWLCPVS